MMPFKEQNIFKTVSFECNTGLRKQFIQDTELDFHIENFYFWLNLMKNKLNYWSMLFEFDFSHKS